MFIASSRKRYTMNVWPACSHLVSWSDNFFRLEWVRSLCGLDQPLFSLRPNDLLQFFISEAEERSSLRSFPVASLRAFYTFRWFSFSFSLSCFWSQRSSLLSLYEPLIHDRIRNKIVVLSFATLRSHMSFFHEICYTLSHFYHESTSLLNIKGYYNLYFYKLS